MSSPFDQLIKPAHEKLGRFLTAPDNAPQRGRRAAERGLASERLDADVLIVGELTIDVPVVVDAPHVRMLHGVWSMGEPRLGGFVTHAVRSAHALGARVHVRTVLPTPMLPCFEQFLEEQDISSKHIDLLPGPCPVTFHFRCEDAVFTMERPGVARSLSWSDRLKPNAYDVVLVDPNCATQRQSLVDALTSWADTSRSAPSIGVWANAQWTQKELRDVGQHKLWIFMDEPNGRSLMSDEDEPSSSDRDAVLSQSIKNSFGLEKLILSCGERGAVMMNGLPEPYRAEACSLKKSESMGCGPTLMTTTMMSSFAGANDAISLRRGVAAASGLVAGLSHPTCFDELDAGGP